MSIPSVAALWLLLPALAIGSALPQSNKGESGPETFVGKARVENPGVAAAETPITIRIDRYPSERELQVMEGALATGGSEAFVAALRKAPPVGRLEAGSQAFTIRWARQRPTPSGRVITLVVDTPVFFVGAGVPGAKPRAGFDVAVLQLVMHSAGIGEGTMAPAARVKPGATPGSVQVDDYAGRMMKLVSIMRRIS
jgi:hypothetical protein